MPYIKPYPGIHDTDLIDSHKLELVETLAVKADKEANGETKDRSEEGVFATSLSDGRIITMYGPSLESLFRWSGDVEYKVVITHKDGRRVEHQCIQKVSGEYSFVHLDKNPMRLPADVLKEMTTIARNFVAANIHRVEFRKKVRDNLLKVLEEESSAAAK